MTINDSTIIRSGTLATTTAMGTTDDDEELKLFKGITILNFFEFIFYF